MATIVSAVALNLRTVRITFSAALADATSLVISNWALACLSPGPFFVPSIASIVGVDSQSTPSAIDITGAHEFSPGLLYSATASGVTGLTGGPGLFYAQIPIQFADRDFAIDSVIPPINKKEDTSGQEAAFVASLQEILTLVLSDHDRWCDILDPDIAPENFVELMLDDLGNAFDFITDLTLSQKRHLAKLLVPIYQLKGTIPGVVQAIRLLLGFSSQLFGFLSGAQGLSLGVDYLGDGTHTGTWFLGGGGPFDFFIKIGTTPVGDGLGVNGYGRALTDVERGIILQILEKMKPAHVRLVLIETGLPPAIRATIQDTGGGSVEIRCVGIIEATTITLFRRTSPGATEFNGEAIATIAGVYDGTPPANSYWVGDGKNASITTEGLYSNEVTNALSAPVLTATPLVRKIRLTWPAVANATSYRIYKSTTSMSAPDGADNAGSPIQIYADVTSYDDKMESGDSFFYIITPVVGNSEGFFSNQVSGTAL